MKHKDKSSEDINDIDSSCTDVESENGQSSASHNDQDSDVSFESDEDEEIDAAEIEEEDWVEYIKRHENKTGKRRNSHNIPARYANGVKPSDEEVANIT